MSKKSAKKSGNQGLIVKAVILVALIIVLVFAIKAIAGSNKSKDAAVADNQVETSENVTQTVTEQPQNQDPTPGAVTADSYAALVDQAKAMAVQYDYQGAIDLLNTIEGAQDNPEILALLADYEAAKSSLAATSPYSVTHIFFHSLVVDPSRGFSITGDSAWDNATAGFCEWMTTVDEFNSIIQQMYERGYVLVSLDDMVDKTTDENGYVHVTAKDIYLPAGKTPFVLSLDDLSYYHSYNGRGTATRMIVGEDGKPTCEYVDANGNTLVGSYDCVPLLDEFIESHPDFSYKGAKGTIALTGYNGILGYRTDYCYRDRVDLTADQEAYLAANPDFNWDNECAQAKAVADAIKADGWTFASHTWGHIRVGDADMEWIQTDTEKWLNYVKPLIGDCDKIIFAHGQDLAAWNEVYSESPKVQYLKDKGFNIFCNVDSAQYFVQIEDGFLRMGRRNLDGYRLWMAVYGGDDRVSDLIDAAAAFDPQRPTDASLYEL